MHPDAFPPAMRPAIRRRLFGTTASPRDVLLTPSRSIFAALSRGRDRLAGWWPATGSPLMLVVLTPQGSLVADAVAALERGSRVTFVGLCGSLRSHRVGDIVEPTSAVLDGVQPRTDRRRLVFPAVTTHTASGTRGIAP
jgi:hypothetical protein